MHKLLILTLLCFFISSFAFSQQTVDTLLLWPNGAPGAMGQENKDQPRLIRYPAPEHMANGAAVVVCPGGGYNALAMDHEGHQIARWLNSFGVSAYVLTYRLGGDGYKHPIPMNDGKRAIRTVRANAEAWGLDKNRIGVLGFSAGGHMASTLGTHFDAEQANTSDPIDQLSSRPDFMVLLYPVISFTEDYQHSGSRIALLGKDADPETVRLLSNELQVTDDTPPAFLVHTTEDKAVSAENSIYFYLELKKRNIPVEMHIFEKGRHGLGMGAPGTGFSIWPQLCEAWLLERGFLKK